VSRRLNPEHASSAIFVGTSAFVSEHRLHRGAACAPLQSARLFVQALDRRQLFGLAKLGVSNCDLQYVYGAVVDLERYRKGVTVLATEGD